MSLPLLVYPYHLHLSSSQVLIYLFHSRCASILFHVQSPVRPSVGLIPRGNVLFVMADTSGLAHLVAVGPIPITNHYMEDRPTGERLRQFHKQPRLMCHKVLCSDWLYVHQLRPDLTCSSLCEVPHTFVNLSGDEMNDQFIQLQSLLYNSLIQSSTII